MSPKNLKNLIFLTIKSNPGIHFNFLSKKINQPESKLNVILDEMINEKQIIGYDNQFSVFKDKQNFYAISKIITKRNGDGFIRNAMAEDIFIVSKKAMNARDGDIVLVTFRTFTKGPKRQGSVVKIIKKFRTEYLGVVKYIDRRGNLKLFIPERPSLKASVLNMAIPSGEDPHIGDYILCVKDTFNQHTNTIQMSVVEILGNINNASIDQKIACKAFGIQNTSHPSQDINLSDKKFTLYDQNRQDLTDELTITVDPETAKDFDDAFHISKTKTGHILKVHIADVAAYIEKNSDIDRVAQSRSNSVYLPAKCHPMLPSEFCDDLCSLKEGLKRRAVTVEIHLDDSGNVLSSKIYRSWIVNDCRLTYKEATKCIESDGGSVVDNMLRMGSSICQSRLSLKKQRDAIEIQFPIKWFEFNDNGIPIKLNVEQYDISHSMIEEFMVLTNTIVSETIVHKKNKEIIYRSHPEPSQDALSEFVAEMDLYGIKIEKTTFSKMLSELDQYKQGQYFKQMLIRKLKMATYSIVNDGHYGLALETYSHFTSPIRRYVDLVIARILFNQHDYTHKELNNIAIDTTLREGMSTKAERWCNQLKVCRWYKKRVKEDKLLTYTGYLIREIPHLLFFYIPKEQIIVLVRKRTSSSGTRRKLGKMHQLVITKVDLSTCDIICEIK
ncbi:RNB domain-containing ribonuclease [Chlamydiia bacterium]|nr:RNB domain-containing ribonuclease [Chlamydiia bacterium]